MLFVGLIVLPGPRSTELSRAHRSIAAQDLSALRRRYWPSIRGLVEPMDKELGIKKRRGAKQR